MSLIVAGSIIAMCLIFISSIFPPSSGELPAPENPYGISEKTRLCADNINLSLILISENINNPVLLICGGGPGIPQYLLESIYPSPLSKHFTVCYWDYRGTSTSYYPGINANEMTLEQYIKDTVAVTEYLSERFSAERIYIMGHSFGTYIALKTVQKYSEKYECYIAMSQIVDQTESEYIAFDYMSEQFEKNCNQKMIKEFKKHSIRNSSKDLDEYFFSGLRDKAMHELGLGTTRNMHSVITGIFFPSLKCTAYTQKERIDIWKGKIFSESFPVHFSAMSFNAFEEVPEIRIPVFFICGAHDYTCCTALQQKYYEYIQAPYKKIYIFENSAHSPLYEEFKKAELTIIEIKNKISMMNRKKEDNSYVRSNIDIKLEKFYNYATAVIQPPLLNKN
ncbi:MAG: alpha/beta hydrolase [Treponema sp.]|nr:alpha/beta hydrolase [Treponema sp.]